MEICKGHGDCIVSKHIDGYEMSCSHNCKPRNCLNFLVCNSNQKNSIMVLGSELCFCCDVTFGKILSILDKAECQHCLSRDIQCVKRFECNHALCFRCFKKAHYGDPPKQPVFPYTKEVEYEYQNNKWDRAWNEDPLIKQYEYDYNNWVEKLYENFKECDPMRTCKEC